MVCYDSATKLHSSRQNLAALGTAAGKNLTAVGSCHSLPETMHLGTMAAAGLVGTLHLVYTSLKSQYARQPDGCSETKSLTIHGHANIV